MTAEAPERPPTPAASDESDGEQIIYTPEEAELRLYTPEEAYAKGLLGFTPSTAKRMASQRLIPHDGQSKIRFKLKHIRAIQDMYEVPAVAKTSAA